VDILIALFHHKDSFRPFLRDLQTSAETAVSHYGYPAALGVCPCPQQTTTTALAMEINVKSHASSGIPVVSGQGQEYPDILYCTWWDSPLYPCWFCSVMAI